MFSCDANNRVNNLEHHLLKIASLGCLGGSSWALISEFQLEASSTN